MSPKYTASSALLRVFRQYIAPYKLCLFGAGASMLTFAYCVTRLIKGIEPLINNIFSLAPDLHRILTMCATLLGVTLVRGLAEFGQNFFIKYIGYRAMCALQLDLFSSLIRSNLAYIKGQPLGHIISGLTNDVFLTRSLLIAFLSGCARHVFLMLFLIVELLLMDFAVALAAFCIFPIVGYLVSFISRRLRAIVTEIQHEFANYTSRIAQIFGSIMLVKSSSAAEHERAAIKAQLFRVERLYKSKLFCDSATLVLVEYMNGLILCGLPLYWALAAARVQGGPGRLTAFLMAFAALYRPFKGMMSLNSSLQEGLAAVIRVFKLLDESKKHLEGGAEVQISSVQQIKLVDVSLNLGGKELLKDCSFDCNRGEITAIYGPEGSGKTSFIDMIAGYQNPSQGQIFLVEGSRQHPIGEISAKSIGLLPQGSFLFDCSIFDNLSYGQTTSLDSVVNVAKSLGVDEFIRGLPQGYDTLAGNIPSKEKRLLCLARLFLKDPPIMLLDEPERDLDQESSKRLFELLTQIKVEKIIIFTSRGLIRGLADRSFILKEGGRLA